MGVVYEAFDSTVGRPIALKLLQAGGMDARTADELRLRFRREAQVAGQLVHPNIVAVYDIREGIATEDGRTSGPFIVMEYVAGGDLKSRIASKARFTLPQIAQVMGQLLSALHYAHARGIVHRDVKPANVLMRENGRLKLTDFGIARIADSDLTQTGEVMGTLTYMSPEQLTGAPVDARADLYSCGVILYELLTGEPPFVGAATTIMQKILNQEALPPSRLNPALPKALDDVLDMALAKRPGERFADAQAFERALAKALGETDDESTLVRPAVAAPVGSAPAASTASMPTEPPARRTRRITIAVATGACLALAAGLAVTWLGPTAASGPAGAGAVSTVAGQAARHNDAASAELAAQERRDATPGGLHSAGEIERMAWDHARVANSTAAFEAYVKAYPDGAYVKLAQVHLAVLSHRTHVAAMPSTGSGAHP
jgi:serine/threonine-protein kinase